MNNYAMLFDFKKKSAASGLLDELQVGTFADTYGD